MILFYDQLLDRYSNYKNSKTKISRECKNNVYFPIIKGIYETNEKTPNYVLASVIYGPSYLSFDYALSYYGLKCITTHVLHLVKKSKNIAIVLEHIYIVIFKKNVFIFMKRIVEGEYSYQIASLEKALCDKMYSLSLVNNIKEMSNILFTDLRIDSDILKIVDLNIN